MIDRRALLAAASGLVLSPAFAAEAPPVLAAYERETGGRIGLYAENLAGGTKIVWRAEERFVMCSTFKASLAASVLARVDRGEDRLEDMVAYGAADLLDYAPGSRQHLTEWLVGCKTGNNRLRGGLPREWNVGDKTGSNGKDASGDIAIAWPDTGGPVLVCASTQGGSPTPKQFEAVFAEIGRLVGRQLG